MRLAAAVVALMFASACYDFDALRCGEKGEFCLDGGDSMDAAVDSGSADSGTDAGSTDAGSEDAGQGDAGAVDSGLGDAGQMDSGQPDSGIQDSGSTTDGGADAGVDAGMPPLAGGIRDPIAVATSVPVGVAFVSSATIAASDATTANQVCASLAADAGLPGTFYAMVGQQAWLLFTNRPLARLDGQMWLEGAGIGMATSHAYYPLEHDERGQSLLGEPVWTGASAPNGTLQAQDACDGGGFAQGTAGAGGHWWNNHFSVSDCSQPAHVYCAEYRADGGTFVAPSPPAGASVVYISDAPSLTPSGAASMDQSCGTGQALIATSAQSALARIGRSPSDGPIYRNDGVYVGPDWAFVSDAGTFAPLSLRADGGSMVTVVLTGSATGPGTTGTSTCFDWIDWQSGQAWGTYTPNRGALFTPPGAGPVSCNYVMGISPLTYCVRTQ